MVKVRENIKDYTLGEIGEIKQQAVNAARKASMDYYQNVLNGQDKFACGFAWLVIYDVKGNTRVGKFLKKVGIEQAWDRSFQLWNPGGLPVQNIDCKEAGANAAAKVFQEYGFTAYGGSRLD